MKREQRFPNMTGNRRKAVPIVLKDPLPPFEPIEGMSEAWGVVASAVAAGRGVQTERGPLPSHAPINGVHMPSGTSVGLTFGTYNSNDPEWETIEPGSIKGIITKLEIEGGTCHFCGNKI